MTFYLQIRFSHILLLILPSHHTVPHCRKWPTSTYTHVTKEAFQHQILLFAKYLWPKHLSICQTIHMDMDKGPEVITACIKHLYTP